MDRHSNSNNKDLFGREDKMGFHIYSEYESIHDEIYTFNSEYYPLLSVDPRPAEKPHLWLIVDNTRKPVVK